VSAAAPLRAPTRGPAALAAARVRGVPLVVLAAVAAAWAAAIAAQASGAASVVHHDDVLADGPPPAGAVLLFLAGWQVMIAAMMLPSSLPLVRMFAAASFPAPGRARAMAAFLGAYALVWTTFGTLAFAADTGLHTLVRASPWLERHEWAVAPSVLLLAGAFQFTSLKDACLRSCRHPASFIHRHYKRGTAGAFRLGARHGIFCVGCCWALMLVLFALGVASLIWMALLTALMVHEKTHPAGARTVPLTGVTLLALGTTLFLWGAAAAPAAATLPIGEQFRVSNAGSDGDANRGVFRGPDVAYNPQAGEYLVVWAADGLATDNEFEVFGQRLSAARTERAATFASRRPAATATRTAGADSRRWPTIRRRTSTWWPGSPTGSRRTTSSSCSGSGCRAPGQSSAETSASRPPGPTATRTSRWETRRWPTTPRRVSTWSSGRQLGSRP
jgi:predicted metal-binding membrane protein